MIRIGQAGIPLSCKGRTNKDGIVYTHKSLDLNAIEIQFVRGLYVLSDEEALFIKDYASKNDIEIHVHAPYYLNLAGDHEEITMSFEKIMKSAQMANNIGSKTLIIHPGFYGEYNPKKTAKLIIKNSKKIVSLFKKEKLKIKLAMETMGKQKVFGSLDEIVDVCTHVKEVIPVLDLGHIHARGNGSIQEREDYEAIFEKLFFFFYENGNELYHVPIKKGDMPLAPLIEVILDRNLNVTLISESPLLEHDAVYIRLQVEKAIMKRTGKETAYYKDLSEVIKK